MKEWLKGAGGGLIVYVVIFSMGSTLGQFHTWLVALVIIIVAASFYIPYQLTHGDFKSQFMGGLCSIIVLVIGFKIHQNHLNQMRVHAEEICGVVANQKLDTVGIIPTIMSFNRRELYQYFVFGSEQGVQRFRKQRHPPDEREAVCIRYVQPKHSWIYSENIILEIRSNPNVS